MAVLRDHLPRRRKASKADAERFMSEAFTNRIAWVAARTLLVRASADAGTDAALRADIDRFLERNPA